VPLFNILLGFSLKGSTALSQAVRTLQPAASKFNVWLRRTCHVAISLVVQAEQSVSHLVRAICHAGHYRRCHCQCRNILGEQAPARSGQAAA